MGGCNLFFFFLSLNSERLRVPVLCSLREEKKTNKKINRSIDPSVTQTKGTANPIILIPGLVQLLQHS